ncbi:MAG: response regulator transcription factor [Lachnospiraceae bacterium]|jgi:DNA-binding response OmpR family regulator|nr:response regulator transcription factor [Lachnospiraceae bacterium]
MRILYVEDEAYTAKAIAEILRRNNYAIDLAYDGERGLDCALSGIYDLLILDIMLPKINGLDILKAFRKEGFHTPVIILTAKGDVDTLVKGLDSGADDYLSKPFRTEELLARIRAIARRPKTVNNEGALNCKDLTLQMQSLTASKGENQVVLTPNEAKLAELLIINHDNIIPKETILCKIWGYDSDAVENHVEVLVSALRKKLASIGAGEALKTIRGAGYAIYSN